MTVIPEVHTTIRRSIEDGRLLRPRRRTLQLVLPSVGLVAVVATATAAATGFWTPQLGSPERGVVTASSDHASAAGDGAISTLNAPQTDEDRSEEVERVLKALSPSGVSGIRLDDVRLLAHTEGGVALLISADRTGPGDSTYPELDRKNQVCLLFEHGAGSVTETCGRPAQIFDGKLVAWLPGDNGATIGGLTRTHAFGIVPDRVTKVRVTFSGGATAEADVQRNFFDVVGPTATAVPAEIEWLDEAGARVKQF